MELRLFLGEFFDAICVTDCGVATAVAQSTASEARDSSCQSKPVCAAQARKNLGPDSQSTPADFSPSDCVK
ncbi:hypothetical protein TIFTF001_039336 [Ficus carica]|uniref:Uncharacterized protein n=1 Tax=Ficus carica TaxID=3494 RepID=A0AA88E8Z2_FICCA|nr:hypothetical protein TIFTF001_039336 [Ficus carica]